MKVNDTIRLMESENAKKLLTRLYGESVVAENIARYQELLKGYEKTFGDSGDVLLFSSPGRAEISGNRTDHNHGKVLAGNINLDCVGVATKNSPNYVHTVSKTYNQDFTINLNHLEPSDKEAGTVDLVKGLLKGFEESGYDVGGFNVYITSNMISAAGASSSVAFEMLLCSMLSIFFSEGRMDNVAYAYIGKYSENSYWDKASGLLNQMACAVGGLITIDFVEPSAPAVERIKFDFGSQNHSLIIVQTGKGHADLSADYSSVPSEMKKAAQYFGKEVLAQVSEEEVVRSLAAVREFAGDRSVLRALHFFEENKEVEVEVAALKENRFEDFLANVTASRNSPQKWLQNCFTSSNYQKQDITVTLALTELFIAGKQKSACRVHGGGFAGVIIAMFPNELVDEYVEYTENCTGRGSAFRMSIRPYGAICINDHMGRCGSAFPKNMMADSRIIGYNKVRK